MVSRKTRSTAWSILAAVAAVAAGGCGGGGSGGVNDKAAAEWALERGGTVLVAGSDLKIDSAEELPKDSLQLLRIDLNKVQPTVTDKMVESLPTVQGLEYLGLHSAQLTDRGLEPVLKLSGLKELELSYTLIGDDGLEQLARLRKLNTLYLYGTQVTAEGVASFKEKRPGCSVHGD